MIAAESEGGISILTLEERLGLISTLRELTVEVLHLFRPELPISDFLQRLAERIGCVAAVCLEAREDGSLWVLGSAGLARSSQRLALPRAPALAPGEAGVDWEALRLPYPELSCRKLVHWSLPFGDVRGGEPAAVLRLYFRAEPALAGQLAGMLRHLMTLFERALFHRRLYLHLAEQKTLLQCENEASTEGILVVSTQGRVVSYNHRLLELWPGTDVTTGTLSEALFAEWSRRTEPREKFEEWSSFLRWHSDVTSRAEINLRDGRSFECYSAPIRSSDGNSFGRGWYFRDITERQVAERERTRLLEEEQSARGSAEQAVRTRDEFLSIAAHELKTPLTPLALRLDALRKWAQAGRPVEISQLDKAHDSMMKLAGLVNDLLDSTRVESGRLSYRFQPHLFNEIVREVVENFRPVSGKHDIQVDAGPKLLVRADRLRLEQVCTNLLDNAIKYSPAGGTVRVRVLSVGHEAVLAVSDSGIGIPEPEQRFLFDRFFRAKNAPINQFGGLGLGLYITRNIVETHGGRIWVESGTGRGTTFFVALPVLALDVQPAPPEAAQDLHA